MIKDNNIYSSGNLSYGKNVLSQIVTLATKEISGVADLHGKGIKCELNGNVADINVYVDVYYGLSMSDIAYRIQSNIKRNVEVMSKYKVGLINVYILGVKISQDFQNLSGL